MAIFGSDDESFLDTLLLYLYQTIVLASLAAAGFIFYLFRTRAPLKEPPAEGQGELSESEQATGEPASIADDEILLRSALLHENTGPLHEADVPSPLNGYAAPPPPPPMTLPYQAPRPRQRREQEEEEEEEEEGPVPTRQPAIRQMVTTRQGVQEEIVHQQPPPFFPQNTGYQEVQSYRDETFYHNQPPLYHHSPSPGHRNRSPNPNPPQFVSHGGYDDALKFEAKKRIGNAIQKKQVQEWVGGGEFDEAITNIRAASQRLQNSGF